MNLFKIIQDLYEEKKRIDKAIGALQELATGNAAGLDASEATTPTPPLGKKRRGRPRKHPTTTS